MNTLNESETTFDQREKHLKGRFMNVDPRQRIQQVSNTVDSTWNRVIMYDSCSLGVQLLQN